jgi:hypothetical protein
VRNPQGKDICLANPAGCLEVDDAEFAAPEEDVRRFTTTPQSPQVKFGVVI